MPAISSVDNCLSRNKEITWSYSVVPFRAKETPTALQHAVHRVLSNSDAVSDEVIVTEAMTSTFIYWRYKNSFLAMLFQKVRRLCHIKVFGYSM
jgi:hypothetical protein